MIDYSFCLSPQPAACGDAFPTGRVPHPRATWAAGPWCAGPLPARAIARSPDGGPGAALRERSIASKLREPRVVVRVVQRPTGAGSASTDRLSTTTPGRARSHVDDDQGTASSPPLSASSPARISSVASCCRTRSSMPWRSRPRRIARGSRPASRSASACVSQYLPAGDVSRTPPTPRRVRGCARPREKTAGSAPCPARRHTAHGRRRGAGQ